MKLCVFQKITFISLGLHILRKDGWKIQAEKEGKCNFPRGSKRNLSKRILQRLEDDIQNSSQSQNVLQKDEKARISDDFSTVPLLFLTAENLSRIKVVQIWYALLCPIKEDLSLKRFKGLFGELANISAKNSFQVKYCLTDNKLEGRTSC